jgi:hypothetical protein
MLFHAMKTILSVLLLACVTGIGPLATAGSARAAEPPIPITAQTAVQATVTVDAGKTLRMMDPQRLGGTNVALWYQPTTYNAPQIKQWIAELHARYIRMPGGSWSNSVYWNGHGVRGADGKVDPSKVGPDGYPAVDYSAYAPSFLADSKTLHPASNGWHGNVDVKTQHDFIKAIPGTEALVCPNAGTGRAVDAAEWVKWANKKMGYNVHYWEIGNELGGSWEPGNDLPFGKGQITAALYTKRYSDMATAMRKMDPTIKIGTCPYNEEVLRDCGANVDFVSIHTYPGSTTLSDTAMFADIGKSIASQVIPVKGWIQQYQPTRAAKIEIAYSEWNLAGGLDNSEMFSGLWGSIFLGELARNGVSLATQWDCFSDLFASPEDGYARKSEYYALWLWNNYMGRRLVPAGSSNQTVYTCASRSDHAVTVMLVNTDRDRPARVNLQLSNFQAAPAGERATVSSREYFYNSLTHHVQWSRGPRITGLKTGNEFAVTVPPYSMTYLRIPDKTEPGLSALAKNVLATRVPVAGTPALRFVMPAEMYAGDTLEGRVIALASGTFLPYAGTLSPATLSADGSVTFDRTQVRLAEDAGHFMMTPAGAGTLTLTARSGGTTATEKITVKSSVPRPIVFWDFSSPPVTDQNVFGSSYTLTADLTQRANRAVARVDLPASGTATDAKNKDILTVSQMPEESKLNKSNIRGLIVDIKTSPAFACADPNASILVVMQSPSNYWMKIGTIPLQGTQDWKTSQLDVTDANYFKALPSAFNIHFILQTSTPAKGAIYLDHVGFLVR